MKNRNYSRTLSALILCLSIYGNSVSVDAQTSFRTHSSFHHVARDEAYAAAFRTMRGRDFDRLLAALMPVVEAERVQNWLDLNNAEFFRALDTAFRKEAAKDIERRLTAARSGEVKNPSKPDTAPAKRKRPVPRGYGRSAHDYWETVDDADDPAIINTGTDEGIETKGSSEKTKVVGGMTITQGATGSMRTILVSGGNVGVEYDGVEYIEHSNKAERTSTRTETAVRYRIVVSSCPDADGISAGLGTMTHALKKTITTPQTIAVMTRDITTRMEIKGFVNDAAEFMYFDMRGGTSESISGYDRAERLGLIEDPEFTDGTNEVAYETLNNQPGPDWKGDKLGDHQGRFRAPTTRAEAERIDKIAGHHIVGIHYNTIMFFKIAETHWQGGRCVELVLTAPKQALLAGEQINVTAETNHKFEKIKLNADLDAVARATVSPEKQRGEPKGTFILTGPPKGDTAMIIVSTVSRRGRASEMIDFAEEKPRKVPVKKPKCDGAWSGTISIDRSSTERSEGGGPGVRITRSDWTASRTYNYTGTVTIRNATARLDTGVTAMNRPIANEFVPITGESRAISEIVWDDKSTSTYSDNCGSRTTERKLIKESRRVEGGTARGTTDGSLNIDLLAGTYSFSLGIPAFAGKDTRIEVRTPTGYCRPQDNEATTTTKESSVDIGQMPILVEDGLLDPNKPNLIEGTRTFMEGDVEVVIRWTLTRECVN